MFHLLFYPVRLVKNHWIFTVGVLIAFYLFLGFTHGGRFVLSRLNPHALWTNDRIVSVVRLAFIDFFRLDMQPEGTAASASVAPTAESGTAVQSAQTSSSSESPVSTTRYRVTATKGLSLRAAPDKSSERLLLLASGSLVLFTGEIKADGDGVEWMHIISDGTTGWSMARWLEPVSDAPSIGGRDGKP